MNQKIFGIEIERKADILSFVAFFTSLFAFIVSLFGIAYQIFGFFEGPEILLMSPRQVMLFTFKSSDGSFIVPSSTMVYVNRGQHGYDGVVLKEKMLFDFKNINCESKSCLEYDWHEFVSFERNEDGSLNIRDNQTVGAFVVNAGGTEVHETWFGPRDDGKNMSYQDIKKIYSSLLMRQSAEAEADLKFMFEVEILEDAPQERICHSQMTGEKILHLEKYGWVALNCK